jgi:putative aldouronate transport system permease protein
MGIRQKETTAFDGMVTALIVLALVLTLVPFVYIVSVSLSSNRAILSQQVSLLPVGFNLDAYATVFRDPALVGSLFYTVFLTGVYTLVTMAVTVLAAYPFSHVRLRGRKFLLAVFLVTMYFSGGIIPDYILVKNLGMLNHMSSLVLPGAMSVYYMLILVTFFQTLPESLKEAAVLDGCNHVGILTRIVLPLSMPALAALSLFYAVLRWNGFMDALFYITVPRLYPIQLKLYAIVSLGQQLDVQKEGIGTYIAPMGLKAASVIFAMIPILLLYPWLQKYFVSGVMLGAVKG